MVDTPTPEIEMVATQHLEKEVKGIEDHKVEEMTSETKEDTKMTVTRRMIDKQVLEKSNTFKDNKNTPVQDIVSNVDNKNDSDNKIDKMSNLASNIIENVVLVNYLDNIDVYLSQGNLKSCKAIIDLGGPLCLVSEENSKELIKSLSSFQKDNLRRKSASQVFKFGQDTLVSSSKILAFPVVGKNIIEIVNFYVIKENIPTLVGLNLMCKLGTRINTEETEEKLCELKIGGKTIPMDDGSHYLKNLHHLGNILGNQKIRTHFARIPEDITVNLNAEDQTKSVKELNDEVLKVFNNSTNDLTEEDKDLCWKIHKFFGHRHCSKVAKMLQHLPRFSGKISKIEQELSLCAICNRRSRAAQRPKFGLPRKTEFNQVISMDLKILD